MSSRKRLRDEVLTPPSTSSTVLPEDSIAAFIALHSPPVKLVRTSPYGFIPSHSSPPPPSRWSDLPLDLFTSVCHFLSSWRDLLRLARVHRHLHHHIMTHHTPPSPHSSYHEDTSQASCWAYVDPVKLTQRATLSINDRLIHLRAKSDKAPPSTASSSPLRCLPFDPAIVDLFFSLPSSSSPSSHPHPLTPTPSQLSSFHHSLSLLHHRPRAIQRLLSALHSGRTAWRASTLFSEVCPLHLTFFATLRLLPSLRYAGDDVHCPAFLFALATFHHLRHLSLAFYPSSASSPDGRTLQALRRTAHHALTALPTLTSLTLLRDDLTLVQPSTLLALRLTHLHLPHSTHLTPALATPSPHPHPLTLTLHSLFAHAGQRGSDVHALPFYFPALLHLSLTPTDTPLAPRSSPPLSPLGRPPPLSSLSGSVDCLARPLRSEGWGGVRRSLTSLALQVRGGVEGVVEVLRGLGGLTELTLTSGPKVWGGVGGVEGGGEGGEGEEEGRGWLPSRWLPALPRLTHLDLHCPALLSDAFLLDLFQLPTIPPSPPPSRSPSPSPSASSSSSSSASSVSPTPHLPSTLDDGPPSLIDHLRSFGLLLNLELTSEATLRRWRRPRCTLLQRLCVQFDDAWMGDDDRDRVRAINDSIALAFAPGTCSRAELERDTAHVAFLLRLGLPP